MECISIKSLYEKYGYNLTYCNISTEDDGYYDLQTEEAGTVCMDGESCKIIKQDDKQITLTNYDGEMRTTFVLTKEEFEVATYGNK